MTTVHYQIADLLADHFTDVRGMYNDDKSYYRAVFKGIFLNFRSIKGVPHGLYLTHTGQELMQSKVRSFHVEMPEGYKITMRDKLLLDRMCKLPYYLEVSTDGAVLLHLYEEELTTVIKLADGNIPLSYEMLEGEKKFTWKG